MKVKMFESRSYIVELDNGQEKALHTCAAHLDMDMTDVLATLILVGLATQIGLLEAKATDDEDTT